MTERKPLRRLSTYQVLIVLAVLFVVLAMLIPTNTATTERYHLTTASFHALLLATIVMPAIVTWTAAFYGFEQMQKYHALIARSKEGQAFGYLMKGSRLVALYLPIVSILTVILTGIANGHPGFSGASFVLSNYIAISLSLVAFWYISTGARLIANVGNVRPNLLKTRLLSLAFIIMGVLYCYVIIRHSLSGSHPYHLPLSWLLLTVVVPYFFAWFMGLLAVLDIDAYATHVPGVLYRKALRTLSVGLLAIISSSILMQYVNSANVERGRLVIGSLLVVHYILYATISAGFVLMGASAKKLQQIEKI